MRCTVGTCKRQQPRKDDPGEGFCSGHTMLWLASKETRAEFVARQEARDMLRGKVLRGEGRAA